MTITLPREFGAVLVEERNGDVGALWRCDLVTPARPMAVEELTSSGSDHSCAFATRLTVDVVSGHALPVAWIDATVLFAYPSGALAAAQSRSDGNGRALLHVSHTEPPAWVAIWVGDAPQGLYAAAEELEIVAELQLFTLEGFAGQRLDRSVRRRIGRSSSCG